MLNNYKGCLLGLAVGDALGASNEFDFQVRILKNTAPIIDMIGGGPFNLNIGEWTDDTSMALCLADSLLEQNGFDAKDQLDKYFKWYKTGYNSVNGICFDIGTLTYKSIDNYINTGDLISPFNGNNHSGNGSLMRLAPVCLFYLKSNTEYFKYVCESSSTTHSSKLAIDSCKYLGWLLKHIRVFHYETLMENKNSIFDQNITFLDLDPVIHNAVLIDYTKLNDGDIKPLAKSGYCVDSLQVALYCFQTTNSFKDGCLLATNLGGDSDTNAAIFGQIAGMYYGIEGIPVDWLEKLAWREKIENIAMQLFEINCR